MVFSSLRNSLLRNFWKDFWGLTTEVPLIQLSTEFIRFYVISNYFSNMGFILLQISRSCISIVAEFVSGTRYGIIKGTSTDIEKTLLRKVLLMWLSMPKKYRSSHRRCRSNHRRCSVKKAVLKNFSNSKENQLSWSLFSVKFQVFSLQFF